MTISPLAGQTDSTLLADSVSYLSESVFKHGHRLLESPEEFAVIVAVHASMWKTPWVTIDPELIAKRTCMNRSELDTTLEALVNRGLIELKPQRHEKIAVHMGLFFKALVKAIKQRPRA